MALNNPIRLGVGILGLLGCVVAPAACDHSATEPVTPITPVPLVIPSQITECETNTQRVCGTWTRVAGTLTYSATWPQGSKATITVVQFDSTAVVFKRVDTAGPTADMNARYVGLPTGASVKTGIVEWTTGGQTFSGKWDATW